jgi:hypothetical protein
VQEAQDESLEFDGIAVEWLENREFTNLPACEKEEEFNAVKPTPDEGQRPEMGIKLSH